MQAGQVGGGGGSIATDFQQLAIQVARLDERTLALQREMTTLRSDLVRLISGLYLLNLVGLTVIGWLVTRAH